MDSEIQQAKEEKEDIVKKRKRKNYMTLSIGDKNITYKALNLISYS